MGEPTAHREGTSVLLFLLGRVLRACRNRSSRGRVDLSFDNPGLNNVDLMIGKRLFVRNGMTAVCRAEFFNLFNHTNFRNVDNSLTSPGFGTVTAAADPRIVQLGLKFTF